MNTRIFLFLLTFIPFTWADKSFHTYAPSRSGECLLIVKATPHGPNIHFGKPDRIALNFSAATITAHPEKPIVYVSSNRDGLGAVIHLKEDGRFASLQKVDLAHGYSYLSLDRANKFLLGNNYGGGQVDVYPLDDEGNIGERTAFLDEGLTAAHCVWPSPDNRHVYIPYVKASNALFQYDFNAKTGKLTPLSPKNAQPPEGTGPRHMAYHPTKPVVYFSNEQSVGISSYNRKDNGQLIIREVLDAFPKGTNLEGVSSSDIIITPDGRFLFIGIRGHKQGVDAIGRYAVDGNGGLTFLGRTPADKIPWGLALSPDGKHLLATGFKAGTLMAFSISQQGELKRTGTLEWDANISDLVTR